VQGERLPLRSAIVSPLEWRIKMDQCAVCGVELKAEGPEGSCKFQAQDYCFCSKECRDEFQRNPQKYAEQAAA